MPLKCPECGSKRVIFLSTTDGTAVGSTDQRYLCKDCGYRGSLILEDGERSKPGISFRVPKPLLVLDLVLFILVLVSALVGILPEPPGIAILFAWIAVFLATTVSFTLQLSQGADEWYRYGGAIVTGSLAGILAGIVLGLDIYGIIVTAILGVLGVFLLSWMFTDMSEEEITKDLARLRRELD